MRFRWSLAVCAGWMWFSATPAPAVDPKPSPEAIEFFEKSVRPVLASHCQSCHGADKQRGGLRLDSRESLISGGDTGPAVVPGEPDKSRLITAVHHSGDGLKMPPKGKLDDSQIAALATWIKNGAPWPEVKGEVRAPTASIVEHAGMLVTDKDRQFWSFRPVTEPQVPAISDWKSEIRNDVDAFVIAKRQAAGLGAAAPADKRTLIRRVTFDLTGLPPSPDEVEAFLADESATAYEKVVERLLASPHYGERWTRHWLDVARYGEDQAHTFQSRKYPQGFRYRDWLVRAFNDDMPYDRFVMEQIAADLLDGPDRKEHLPALGYFACGPVYYGDAKKLDQYDDRIDTLTRGFLGLTVACARCHDHKFDPIPTADYYSLAGVFASTDYDEVPLVSAEEVEAAKKALTEDEKKKKVAPKFPLIHALKDLPKPVTMRVHVRGNSETLGPESPHHFLTVLTPAEPAPWKDGSGRLDLAKAIASADNPLTARVFVNRVWRHHFGQGIVRTTSNFGALGERPTHPELLDYLATRFVKSGWSIKAMHRLIVMSATYRQTSVAADPRGVEVDPENTLLWRMNRRRLEVEAWRDAMLAASGTLDRTLGGPSGELNSPDYRRRTFYGVVSRHDLNPLLRLFDFPDPNITADKRPETTVPLQQLFVLNSEFMVRNARALAGAVAAADDDADRIKAAYLRLYGRQATEREVSLGLVFLSSPSDGVKLTRWEQYAQALLAANEFLYVD